MNTTTTNNQLKMYDLEAELKKELALIQENLFINELKETHNNSLTVSTAIDIMQKYANEIAMYQHIIDSVSNSFIDINRDAKQYQEETSAICDLVLKKIEYPNLSILKTISSFYLKESYKETYQYALIADTVYTMDMLLLNDPDSFSSEFKNLID